MTASPIMLNVTVPMKIPDEKEAKSARNLKWCLYYFDIADAIKKGEATNTDTMMVQINDSGDKLA
ncbi:MAG TPA: hypothetical protein VD815_01195 [Candidatus Saccharimonadales bacterium]|nr:hypothetical protein [Candidatus Saccharimonadales bacterium]